ncbi:hypothetical protein OG2516_18945 [Oceanicola granulosus HTCC2516]|uniref:Uncharacterized protein n=1 Tax=Oceanicola granulosus (strain ATCC BAA-861 / DSM 15982 / KCTC 12143 / HTCC2516) TaxID=314256 RepID=Q2CBS9_OCEGH|nr:hypothetical protein OG2516_18945 [Oceanicola granulosus HTCC2516]
MRQDISKMCFIQASDVADGQKQRQRRLGGHRQQSLASRLPLFESGNGREPGMQSIREISIDLRPHDEPRQVR